MNAIPVSELSKNQTRVVVLDSKVEDLLYHVLQFSSVENDFLSASRNVTLGSDFSLLVTDDLKEGASFIPNIVFISCGTSDPDIANLLKCIVGGGAVIYPESNIALAEHSYSTQNYFRKIPYAAARYSSSELTPVLETSLGGLPLPFSDHKLADLLEGLRILCQQLGVMEEAFYEALLSFSPARPA